MEHEDLPSATPVPAASAAAAVDIPSPAEPAPPASVIRQGEEEEEEFKLILLNYGKWKDAKSLEQFLREHHVVFRKVQKSRQLSFGFIHFHTQEERDAAMPKLLGLEWNGSRMDVKNALPRKSMKPMRHPKKRSRGDAQELREGGGDGEDGGDAAAVADAPAAPKEARDVVTPWADVPYDEQLHRKESEMKKVLVKIVRQTRKEYFKKDKRIANEQRHAKKHKGEQGEAAPVKPTHIPTWLTSHGSLFVVADEVLYSRPHEATVQEPWDRLIEAAGVSAIVSFGSELVAATVDNTIMELKQGPVDKYWDKICDGPGEAIVSLASLRNDLLCVTATGKILKQEGSGRFATGQWTELALVESATSLTIHNGYAYVFSATDDVSKQWQRAKLTGEGLDSLLFEAFEWGLGSTAISGLCSHDHQIIALSGLSLLYSNPDVQSHPMTTVDLQLGFPVQKLGGLASHKGLCCPMDSIHASPSTEGYRNKCEFSIGFDEAGKPCVGFRMGLFRDGSVVVSPPRNCVNVSPVMERVCEAVQGLIESSRFPVYDVNKQTGVWRLLTVRHSDRTNQLMIVLQINPKNLSDDDKGALRDSITTKLTDSSLDFSATSLFVQEYEGVSAASEDEPLIHLHGARAIEEHLLGKRFSVSPNAFFQVNTQGAETLYSLVKNHANADEKTLLFDVCCGTGTIGICASAGAGKVVGIEICKAATDDAGVNATLNGVENISFVNSKAEDVMKDLLKSKQEGGEDSDFKRVVAIVDPPRAGLHHQVLRSLRSCPPVERIVYVSCNPTGSLIQDAVTLCGPKTKSITGQAFQPVHAIPVDMFPHTPHCEMIIVFDRVQRST